MERQRLILLLLIFPFMLQGQRAGENVYSFLQLTNSARVAALGGENVSIPDGDINLVFHNPALLSPGMDQHLNLNYINYYAGVNYGYSSYAFDRENVGTFAAGIHYVNYGLFERRDEFGNLNGYFRASEYALNLVFARPIIDSVLAFGVNIKPVFSVLEQYTSLGITSDIGLIYTNHNTNTYAGLVLKNAGLQITSYSGTREKVPFEIQAGITQGLAHAPFRFSLLLQHLERWDLTYDLEEEDNFIFTGEEDVTSQFDILADKLMRHAVFGVELLLGENFHFDIGYNYKRRQEMKMNMYPGMVGFSWGFGFRVNRFHVAYGRSVFHIAGGTNHFSLTTDLSSFYRAK